MDREVRPRSAPHSATPQARSGSRKIFNCIVDDTALVAGVKRSTRNGLRQWVKSGQIRLFVPLYALEQLSVSKTYLSRHGEDVRETLDWLDQATTKHPDAIALQGGDEVFETWDEVERFAVPRSLFSELDDHDFLHADSGSALDRHSTTRTHTRSSSAQEAQPDWSNDLQTIKEGGVPLSLRPLFNYILWRIHQELDPTAALESFIFLCNDSVKAHVAKGFEVRCKRLEQLRETVGREDREARNRQLVQHRSTHSVESALSPVSPEQQSPMVPTAPAAMSNTTANFIDPDAFDRMSTSPRQHVVSPARGVHSNSRGGRASMRGRGGSTPSLRDPSGASSQRGRGLPQFVPVESEIDPNSFERPRGGHNGRGGRRLWMPT